MKIGTSGWTYESWRGRFYPQGLARRRWLGHYAERFDAVEVNGTFYGLPKPETFRSWADQVPPSFRFAIKGSRYVTHQKKLVDTADSVELVVERARGLGEHLGPILWQLEARHALDQARLTAFLDALPRDVAHVLEARHPSWAIDRVRQALADAGVAFACWDLLGRQWVEEPTASFAYVRFHGPTSLYGGSYDRELLRPWVDRIERWREQGREVWAFFNNDIDGHAVEDAERLRSMLGSGADWLDAMRGALSARARDVVCTLLDDVPEELRGDPLWDELRAEPSDASWPGWLERATAISDKLGRGR